MKGNVLTAEAARSASLNLTEGRKGHPAMHTAVVALQAGRRSGAASTKTRNEVAGSGKKLWRQKGTGRARMGSIRAPHWRGGGTVFGPRPRDYSQKVNRKVRQLALRAAITARINDGDIIVIPAVEIADGKTKTFLKLLRGVTDATKILVVSPDFDAATERSARNLPTVHLVRAAFVNCEHLLNCDKVLLTEPALEIFAKRTAPLS